MGEGLRPSPAVAGLQTEPPPPLDLRPPNPFEVAVAEQLKALLSAGDYASSLWDFGDGETSTETDPTHTYAAGWYDVTLTVGDGVDTSVLTRPGYIAVVQSAVFLPLAARSHGPCSPLWSDDFADPGSGWPVEDDSYHTFAYTGGEYQMVGKSTNWALVSSPGVRMSDGVIVASMRFAGTGGDGDNGGIMFGQALDEEWNFYRYTVQRNGYYCIQRHVSGYGWVTIHCDYATGYLPYPAQNRLKVVRNGSAITVYINDQFLATVYDGIYLGSLRVGLSAGSGTNSADLRFDDYAIYRVSCSDQVGGGAASTRK